MFGPGQSGSANSKYPASCGGPGTTTARGPLAKVVAEPGILKPLSALRPWAVESTEGDADLEGGNGSAVFQTPAGSFGLLGGVPVSPSPSLVEFGGGPIPRDRRSQVRDYYVTMIVLFEYAK